jgi:hypothetical protein
MSGFNSNFYQGQHASAKTPAYVSNFSIPPPTFVPVTSVNPPPSGYHCVSECKTSPLYNNQLQCGVPNPLTGLMATEPAKADCVNKLMMKQHACLASCAKITSRAQTKETIKRTRAYVDDMCK